MMRQNGAMERKQYEPLYRDGRRVYAQGMAGSSIKDNSYSVSTCTVCSSLVAWAQSSRTGKWYACDVAEYLTDGGYPRFRAVPYNPHYKTCERKMRQRAEWQAEDEAKEAERQAKIERLEERLAEAEAAGDDSLADALREILEEVK